MNTLIQDIQHLDISEKIQLVEDIWDTIAAGSGDLPKLTRSEREELDRRRDAQQTDPASGIPWEKVRAKLFRR